MIYAVVNEFLGKVTFNSPEAEALLVAALVDESRRSPQMHQRLEEVFSPIFFHFPHGSKGRSIRQLNDTSQYIRQWYELAACRLPVLRSTAAAAATEHGRELSKAEVTLVFKQYMEDLKTELRPDQLGEKWTSYKSCTEAKMRRMAGHTFVANCFRGALPPVDLRAV